MVSELSTMGGETERQPSGPPETAGLRLVVQVPCLNEEKTVGTVVAAVPRSIPGIADVRVLVIDDGSTDDTAKVAREAGASVLKHPSNRGLGRTFRDGVERALEMGADILVNIDGDGQFDAGSIPELVEPIVKGRAQMVTASRFMNPDLVPEMPAIKRWGNRRVANVVRLLTGRRFHDVSCGFRAFSREALLRMNLFGTFTYTQETFLDLVFRNMTILEKPLPVRGTREFGESRIAASIPRYAVRSLQIMMRAFIAYRPFTFFSVIAVFFMALGSGLLGFLAVHYLQSSAFSPHIWAGFVGGSFLGLGILTLVIGVLGDILVRIRQGQEKILDFLKIRAYEARVADDDPPL